MKIRSCFVSNSSSSSFIFIGVEIDAKDFDYEKYLSDIGVLERKREDFEDEDEFEDYLYYELEIEKYIISSKDKGALSKDKIIVGKEIATTDECGSWDNRNVFSYDIINLCNEVSTMLNKVGINENLKLFTLERLC